MIPSNRHASHKLHAAICVIADVILRLILTILYLRLPIPLTFILIINIASITIAGTVRVEKTMSRSGAHINRTNKYHQGLRREGPPVLRAYKYHGEGKVSG